MSSRHCLRFSDVSELGLTDSGAGFRRSGLMKPSPDCCPLRNVLCGVPCSAGEGQSSFRAAVTFALPAPIPKHFCYRLGPLRRAAKRMKPRKPCYNGSSGSGFVAVVVVVVVVAAAEALLVLVVVMAVVVGTWWCCYTLKDTRLYQTVLKSLTARKLHLLPRFSLHEPRLCT